MKQLPHYNFYKNKYGNELLIDVVPLHFAKRFLREEKAHTLSYYDITLITEGEGFFAIDGTLTQVKSKDIIFTQPGEIREWDTTGIIQGYALIFEEEFLLSFFNDPHFIINLSYFKTGNTSFRLSLADESLYERILKQIKEIQSEINTRENKDTHMLRALLYETLILLNRTYEFFYSSGNEVNISGRYLTRFFTLINTFYKKHHEVGFYAGELCITSNHLNEIVKTSTGINAKTYIQNKLLLEAKRLLVYTELPITEITEQLGYENSSYFIRIFRSHTGTTPLQYRKLSQNKE